MEAAPEPRRRNLDSGYAWCILLVMFLIQSSISGSSRVYGIVYAKQVSVGYYDREQASWPIASASAVENLASILTPALAHRLSWRQIELLSTCLFIGSNLLAYASDSLWLDILALGCVQGLALSTSTPLSLAINNDYFERYRTTAYGISMSGSTFGVLYLTPIVAWLLESYADFRLVYLALAAVFACNLALVAFIKPRSATLAEAAAPAAAPQPAGPHQLVAIGGELGVAKEAAGVGAAPARKRSRFECHFERQDSLASISLGARTRRLSTFEAGAQARRASQLSAGLALKLDQSQAAGQRDAHLSLAGAEPAGGPAGAAAHAAAAHAAAAHAAAAHAAAAPAKRRGLSAISFAGDPELGRAQPAAAAAAAAAEAEFSLRTLARLIWIPYLHCTWIMLALYYLVARIFIIILVDFAADHGLSLSQSTSLLNYWSLGELLGRVLLGSLIDLRWLSCKACITLTCVLLAACIGAMVLVESYLVYAACSLLVAALISLEYMLINVLMVEYLGKQSVTSCYSLAACISSLVLFGRPSLIGLFRDRWGSYDGLLALLAALVLAFGLLFQLLEPLLVRRWPKCREQPAAEAAAAP